MVNPKIIQIEAEGERVYALDASGNIYQLHFHKGTASLILLNQNDSTRFTSTKKAEKLIDNEFSKQEKKEND